MPEPTFERMVQQASSWVRRVQYELDTVHFVKATCDEASLLFPNSHDLSAWCEWAMLEGYEHLGSVAEDHMHRVDEYVVPIDSFDVRFEFFRIPGATWRIEAMAVLDGTAPLHEQALEDYGPGCVVHVSWRAAPNGDQDGYLRHRKVMETSLGSLEPVFQPLAEYVNSYGRFCYYGEKGKPPYLKPRVNLRDQ